MLFNSFAFAVFLPLIFVLYWAIFNRKNVALRNAFLLAASYVFYGWWDWRFLSLIAISSLIDFVVGQKIGTLNERENTAENNRSRRIWLWISIGTNIGILGFFKYCNFFVDGFISMFAFFGVTLHPSTLHIILPVGISFYTFQTLSYTLDIYRRQIAPVKDWLQFFTFVSFFPQLVAGPIERAKNLLPQFATLKKPDYNGFHEGLLLVAWGFFKKLMLADRLGVLVDSVYGHPATASGLPMLLGAAFFALQLYFDFSAYSDIATGIGKLLGFDLMTNFRRPYLSVSFGNFWKRWHISLSSWFMDYVYIPLGGNRKGKWRMRLNILIVFAVSGLWHGASWNFVIWGTLNALFYIAFDPLLNLTRNKATGKDNPVFRTLKSVFIFACWALSLVFFRAGGFETALNCFANLGFSGAENIANFGLNVWELYLTLILLATVLVKEIVSEKSETLLPAFFFKIPAVFRLIFYAVILLSIIYLGQYGGENENAFIYFQF